MSTISFIRIYLGVFLSCKDFQQIACESSRRNICRGTGFPFLQYFNKLSPSIRSFEFILLIIKSEFFLIFLPRATLAYIYSMSPVLVSNFSFNMFS